MYAFCLSNLDVHFTLIKNGEQVLSAPKTTSVVDRASQLWADLSPHCIMLKQLEIPKSYFVQLTGFITQHQYARYNKNRIFFFVNGRLVKNPALARALLKGYLNVLPPMKFPAGCIYITVDQATIDVNVHPRKEEILFTKPRVVESAITVAVTNTLSELFAQKLGVDNQSTPEIKTTYNTTHTPLKQFVRSESSPFVLPVLRSLGEGGSESRSDLYRMGLPAIALATAGTVENDSQVPNELGQATIIGQLKKTYILLDHPDGLLMVDQHAAHERVMYEKFRAGFLEREGTRLLFPETIEATPHELELLEEHAAFFASQGVEFDVLGASKLAIKTAPPKVHASLRDFMREAIDFMVEHERLDREAFAQKLREHVHAQMACKAAIKGGDVLSVEAMAQLLKDLAQTDNRFICAHGRPTMWRVTYNEIERNFKRRV